MRKHLIALIKSGLLRVFRRKGADHTGTGIVLSSCQGHAVQLALHIFVSGHGQSHNAKYHQGQRGNHHNEDQRAAHINGKRHHRSTQYNKGRTQKQTQHQVHAVLRLGHIVGHSGDQRGAT